MEPTRPTMPAEAIEAYNLYIHGEIDRRSFIDRVKKVAVSGVAAAAIVDPLMPNYAAAQQVSPTDPRLKTEYATVPSPQGQRQHQGLPRAPGERGHRPGCPASWSFTRTAGSTRTSRTSPGASRSRTSWRSRRTGSRRSAAIPATTRRAESCSGRSIARRWRRTSTPPRCG